MKKFARPIALLAGLTLLVGCETLTQNWLPIAADHRPQPKTASVTGKVVDGTGNPLPHALVTNRAAVTFSDANGLFTLSKVNTGMQYITASFDGVKSLPVEIEVLAGQENSIPKIVVAASRPVSEGLDAVRLLAIEPGTLTATYSAEATDSAAPVGPVIYGAPTYPETKRDVTLLVSAPPNGAGTTIRSYRVQFDDAALPVIALDFPTIVNVAPGSPTQSGPPRVITIKNVGLNSVAFARALHTSDANALAATITLYAGSAATQATSLPISLHAPSADDSNATESFRARVIIEPASE